MMSPQRQLRLMRLKKYRKIRRLFKEWIVANNNYTACANSYSQGTAPPPFSPRPMWEVYQELRKELGMEPVR